MASEYLRFFHIAAAFLLVAGIALATYGGQKASRSRDPDRFEGHLRTSAVGGMPAFVGTLAVSILGILTAWKQGWPLTSTGWLIASYIAVFFAVVFPAVTLKRWGEKAEALMPQARERGEVLPEQIRLIGGRAARLAEATLVGLLAFILVLMVFKPF